MADTAAAVYLAEVRKNYEVFGDAAAMPRLLAAVEAVLVLHEPDDRACSCCLNARGEPVDWPCPTYRAISSVLLGDGGNG